MKLEALYYTKLEDKKVRCNLCPHNCILKDNQWGICKVRRNEDGILYTYIYASASSIALDPIEKKPLYHFYPSHNILSLGTIGCNMKCIYCQNWQISQADINKFYYLHDNIPSKDIVSLALKYKTKKNNIGIAYTYNEPVIWYEYVYNTAKLAKENGLKNVLVTNAYINRKPFINLLQYVDAVNVDLKAFNNNFYLKYCKAKLDDVLQNLKLIKELNVHLEITNLVIPTLNDDLNEIEQMLKWIKDNLGKDSIIHFSRYHPDYKLDIPATDIEKLVDIYKLAKKYLEYVYLGNVLLDIGSDTICPECGTTLIERNYMTVNKSYLKEDKCFNCGYKINIEL